MKRCIALVLSLLMLVPLLASCSSGSEDTAEEPVSSVQSSEVPEATATEPGAESQPQPEQEDAPPQVEPSPAEITYPLSAETVTLSYFCYKPDGPPIVEQSWADLQIFQDAETLTNVRIKWVENSRDTYSEKFSLMFASGDFNDIVQAVAEQYSGGIAKAFEDEVILDLSKLTDANMPNYSAKAHTSEYYPYVLSDDGQELSICEIADKLDIQKGLFIRGDWMAEQGLQTPSSIDELTNVMTVLKDAYDCSDTMLVSAAIGGGDSCYLTAPYGFTGFDFINDASNVEHFYIDESGNVSSALVTPSFKDFVSQLNQWYTDGLYSYEALIGYSRGDNEAKMTNGSSAVTHESATAMTTYYALGGEGYNLTAVPPMTLESGQEAYNPFFNSWYVSTGTAVSISSQCENVEIALQWLDYWYSEDGYLSMNYGPQGVSWEYDDNNGIRYTPLITDDPDWGTTTLIMKYNCKNRLFGYALQDSNINYYSDDQLSAVNTFRKNTDNSRRLPTGYITLTANESDTYSSLYSDISTYASTEVMKFVLGETGLDQWDSFQSQLEQMGIYDCISVYQAAYERYLGRS